LSIFELIKRDADVGLSAALDFSSLSLALSHVAELKRLRLLVSFHAAKVSAEETLHINELQAASLPNHIAIVSLVSPEYVAAIQLRFKY
jgi:hypothetical protein